MRGGERPAARRCRQDALNGRGGGDSSSSSRGCSARNRRANRPTPQRRTYAAYASRCSDRVGARC